MSTDNQNIWFGISMGLMGLIVGFMFASFNGSAVTRNNTVGNVPQAPTQQDQPQAPPVAKDVVPVDVANEHIRGNKKATLAFIEYADLECPFCASVHPTIQQVIKEYPNDVLWVFRQFPLPERMHPNAHRSAEASECAAELGGNDAFWKFVEGVYAGQDKGLSDSLYVSVARSVGINTAKFQSCLDSGKYKDKVDEQQMAGSNSGIEGTPGNIILNMKTGEARLVPGARKFADFKKEIDEMLAK